MFPPVVIYTVINTVGRHKKQQTWEDLSNCVKSIGEKQTFLDFKLLLPSEWGRMTRSQTAFARQICDYEEIKRQCV